MAKTKKIKKTKGKDTKKKTVKRRYVRSKPNGMDRTYDIAGYVAETTPIQVDLHEGEPPVPTRWARFCAWFWRVLGV